MTVLLGNYSGICYFVKLFLVLFVCGVIYGFILLENTPWLFFRSFALILLEKYPWTYSFGKLSIDSFYWRAIHRLVLLESYL